MQIELHQFFTPKEGNNDNEYEDAFYPVRSGLLEGDKLLLALADGASESMFSKQWAECLVRHFCSGNYSNSYDFVEQTIVKWEKCVKLLVQSREDDGKPLWWYEEIGIDRGAFSTLLGLTIKQTEGVHGGVWEALTVGDSCLFQVRDDQLIAQFPPLTSADFNNHPLLISSNRKNNSSLKEVKNEKTGFWQQGDQLFLMTDAMAHWFIQMIEFQHEPWRRIYENNENQIIFSQWINYLRDSNNLRNDDVTVICIEILSDL